MVLAGLTACGSQSEPVASLQLGSQRIELPHRRYVPLRFEWRPVRPLEGLVGELYVFVHLLDVSGNVVRTFDHPWPARWRRGVSVGYETRLYQSALGPPLDPGTYPLTVGLYDVDGNRWPLNALGQDVGNFEYKVADVEVPAEGGESPLFRFSSAWRPAEPGRDQQILARRWLFEPGDLLVENLNEPGTLWLSQSLATPTPSDALVLEEGASQQQVLVRSDCSPVEVRVTGSGGHDVLLPLEPAASGARSCLVELIPNFYVLHFDSLAHRTLSLEILAWAPG